MNSREDDFFALSEVEGHSQRCFDYAQHGVTFLNQFTAFSWFMHSLEF
jgi:hypothetical protein